MARVHDLRRRLGRSIPSDDRTDGGRGARRQARRDRVETVERRAACPPPMPARAPAAAGMAAKPPRPSTPIRTGGRTRRFGSANPSTMTAAASRTTSSRRRRHAGTRSTCISRRSWPTSRVTDLLAGRYRARAVVTAPAPSATSPETTRSLGADRRSAFHPRITITDTKPSTMPRIEPTPANASAL